MAYLRGLHRAGSGCTRLNRREDLPKLWSPPTSQAVGLKGESADELPAGKHCPQVIEVRLLHKTRSTRAATSMQNASIEHGWSWPVSRSRNSPCAPPHGTEPPCALLSVTTFGPGRAQQLSQSPRPAQDGLDLGADAFGFSACRLIAVKGNRASITAAKVRSSRSGELQNCSLVLVTACSISVSHSSSLPLIALSTSSNLSRTSPPPGLLGPSLYSPGPTLVRQVEGHFVGSQHAPGRVVTTTGCSNPSRARSCASTLSCYAASGARVGDLYSTT